MVFNTFSNKKKSGILGEIADSGTEVENKISLQHLVEPESMEELNKQTNKPTLGYVNVAQFQLKKSPMLKAETI